MIAKLLATLIVKIDSATLADVVFINFLILKLAGLVTWSWLMVFLPLIIYYALFLIVLVVASVLELKFDKEFMPDPNDFMDRMGNLKMNDKEPESEEEDEEE